MSYCSFRKVECSEKEMELFAAFGVTSIVHHIDAVSMYRMLIQQAFLGNDSGPHVEALRRGAKALLVDARPYRLTAEFDDLISF